MATKYAPLEKHLRSLARTGDHSLTFAEIETILAAPLPPSARKHQAWWANQRGSGHVQAHSWLNARFHTRDLDLRGRTVTFTPVDLSRELADTRRRPRPLTIEQAKAGLSAHLGVPQSAIEIIVKA